MRSSSCVITLNVTTSPRLNAIVLFNAQTTYDPHKHQKMFDTKDKTLYVHLFKV